MADQVIATAADYADAMLTARRAKNALALLVLLMLLIQIGVFFTARFTGLILPSSAAATQPSPHAVDLFEYLVGFSDFLGIVLTIVLSFTLLLIINIMLVGRLIGIARTTSAYVWCLILLVLLFPWQAFLSNATFSDPNFKIPGVLYTWDELRQYARFGLDGASVSVPEIVLRWARFAGLPLVAVIITLMVQAKSNRGIRQAFGEYDEAPLDRMQTSTATPTTRAARV
jgi:hypothetical protein